MKSISSTISPVLGAAPLFFAAPDVYGSPGSPQTHLFGDVGLGVAIAR
jgi:hypothetical protein